jgi:hypothetical protein
MQVGDRLADGKNQLMIVQRALEKHWQHIGGGRRLAERILQFAQALVMMPAQLRDTLMQACKHAVM